MSPGIYNRWACKAELGFGSRSSLPLLLSLSLVTSTSLGSLECYVTLKIGLGFCIDGHRKKKQMKDYGSSSLLRKLTNSKGRGANMPNHFNLYLVSWPFDTERIFWY